jgi:ankyrin repeat protein
MKNCLTPAMVRAELKRMPDTLDQMYDRILQAIPRLHQQYVQAALCWIAFSARPLTLPELGEAVIIDAEEESFDPENSRLRDHTLILNLCGSLVAASDWLRTPNTIDWVDEKMMMEAGPFNPSTHIKVVSLSHYSVKEYIISRRLCDSNLSQFYISEKLAHQLLAKACLVYLLEFNKGGIASHIDFVEFPLLHYCAYNWMRHWRGGTENAGLQRLLIRLFDPTDLNSFVNWLNISNPDIARSSWSFGFGSTFTRPQERKRSHELYPQPLYFAALLGDIQLIHFAIEGGCDVSAKEGNLGSALAVAAFQCHEPIVEFLLENGADPNGGGGRYGSVLQAAAVGGSECIVRLLLNAGADLNTQNGEYNTALVAAASTEHDKVVSLLVSRGADLSIRSTAHGSSLYQAAATGDTTMVLALLGAGADINEIAEEKGTALCAAAQSGSIALVQLLLRRSADVNKGGDGGSSYPLIEAAGKGHSQVVRVLIRAGAHVDISGGPYGFAALEAAVQSRDMATFRTLLDAGADIYFKGGNYKDCLHAAIWTGELGMAKFVLEMVTHVDDLAFLDAVGRYEQDPYFFHKMMELGANVDAHSGREGSALHIAVKRGCKEAVWLLLNNNPYINAVAETGSVLRAAIDAEMDDVAEELIHRGANVNISGTSGTPFQAACRRGDLAMATRLLENGADVNASSSDYPLALVSFL